MFVANELKVNVGWSSGLSLSESEAPPTNTTRDTLENTHESAGCPCDSHSSDHMGVAVAMDGASDFLPENVPASIPPMDVLSPRSPGAQPVFRPALGPVKRPVVLWSWVPCLSSSHAHKKNHGSEEMPCAKFNCRGIRKSGLFDIASRTSRCDLQTDKWGQAVKASMRTQEEEDTVTDNCLQLNFAHCVRRNADTKCAGFDGLSGAASREPGRTRVCSLAVTHGSPSGPRPNKWASGRAGVYGRHAKEHAKQTTVGLRRSGSLGLGDHGHGSRHKPAALHLDVWLGSDRLPPRFTAMFVNRPDARVTPVSTGKSHACTGLPSQSQQQQRHEADASSSTAGLRSSVANERTSVPRPPVCLTLAMLHVLQRSSFKDRGMMDQHILIFVESEPVLSAVTWLPPGPHSLGAGPTTVETPALPCG
ncbi:unnamed protein product [Lota lota]